MLSYRSRRPRTGRLATFLIAVWTAACSDEPAGDLITAPEGPAPIINARADSLPQIPSGGAPITTTRTAAASIVLPVESGFTVEFVDRECAAVGNRVTLTSPVFQVLLRSGCQAAFPQTWRFDGPFPAGTVIAFLFRPGTRHPGAIRVSGGFPVWTLSFEDSTDDDFNDLVFTVTAECPFFPTPPADPLLADQAVQRGLQDLWDNSNPNDPNQANRFEQGGWIVERNGQREVIPFGGDPQPCRSESPRGELQAIQASGATILGFAHTHPHTFGTAVPTDGSCNGNRLPGRTFGDGPSYADERVMSGSPWPQYIIDENRVHRLDPNHQAGDPLNSPVDRNPNCS